MSIDSMFVDIGATSREEVAKLGVRLGDPVAPRTTFEPLARKGRYVAKAFDNRVGMAALVEAGHKIAGMKRSNHVLLGQVCRRKWDSAECKPWCVMRGPRWR